MKTSTNLLKPLCEYFKAKMLKVKSILNIDETWCRVRIKYKGDGTKLGKYFKKYVWVLVNKIDKLVRVHVRAKFKYAADISKDADAVWFVEQIGRLYLIEAENILLHRTPEEIKLRRSKDDVTRILSSLTNRARKMIKNKHLHYGDLMDKALHYMLNGWAELLTYRQDGRYTIDNLVAERASAPLP